MHDENFNPGHQLPRQYAILLERAADDWLKTNAATPQNTPRRASSFPSPGATSQRATSRRGRRRSTCRKSPPGAGAQESPGARASSRSRKRRRYQWTWRALGAAPFFTVRRHPYLIQGKTLNSDYNGYSTPKYVYL